MNAIEGFTSIMLKRMAGVEFNEKSERYLNKVQSNSQRLLHLINDFLDLSRIESGRLELASMPISPANMVERWKNELSVLAEGKGIGFEVSLDPDIPATIYGDEEALSKITTNLLGNAFKFTSEGKVSLSLERLNGSIAIKVQDTGIGIPPHAREFIFDEFRQVDQSSKRKYGGTGLGLAIVQKLAREMNGTVALESELGKGSTFTVTIPLQTEKVLA
jgi:signal transduction histidine kinase